MLISSSLLEYSYSPVQLTKYSLGFYLFIYQVGRIKAKQIICKPDCAKVREGQGKTHKVRLNQI